MNNLKLSLIHASTATAVVLVEHKREKYEQESLLLRHAQK
jgi:hypothetical protein